ncbi:MAG: hypothetical protein KTR25_16025 [Myxococcales bacterium]|nr:hypothetical protein [Myxococcales bacterium]
MRAGLDQQAARACLYPPAGEMTPYPACVSDWLWREGTGCTGPMGPESVAKPPTPRTCRKQVRTRSGV